MKRNILLSALLLGALGSCRQSAEQPVSLPFDPDSCLVVAQPEQGRYIYCEDQFLDFTDTATVVVFNSKENTSDTIRTSVNQHVLSLHEGETDDIVYIFSVGGFCNWGELRRIDINAMRPDSVIYFNSTLVSVDRIPEGFELHFLIPPAFTDSGEEERHEKKIDFSGKEL